MSKTPFNADVLVKVSQTLMALVILLLVVVVLFGGTLLIGPEKLARMLPDTPPKVQAEISVGELPGLALWQAPNINELGDGPEAEQVRYGQELISYTSEYLGPKGKVMPISNGMNCQNCHLDAGTRPFGNNYSAVAANYPLFRARSGTEETVERRVNDCFERSLNGKPLNEQSKEMQAIVAYINWLGKEVPAGSKPEGVGLAVLEWPDYAADPKKGNLLYDQKCTVCHGKSGEGIANGAGTGWIYPPLWGANSYNNGAGLYRISRFAGYIKANMPLGATWDNPQLSDEEAWHIAAYVNSQSRPARDLSADWPDISKKPMDHPFGPYADGFDEQQHKYGPFRPIIDKGSLTNK